MFCQTCGTQIADDAQFCHKCGAKIVRVDTVSQRSAIQVENEKVENIHISQEGQDKSDIPKARTCGADEAFRNYMNSRIRATTDFQSAEELLNSHVSFKLAWSCAIIPSLLIGLLTLLKLDPDPLPAPIAALLLSVFSFAIFFNVSYFFVWRKRNQCASKFSGKFEGDIDAQELIQFLNEALYDLAPYFHEWGFLQQSGYSVRSLMETSLETALSKGMQEIRLCTEFGKKTNLMTILYLRPDVLDKESGKKEYFVDVKQKVSFGLAGFSTYTCVYKTAPIIQAAMEYYLSSRQNGEPILTEKADAAVIAKEIEQLTGEAASCKKPGPSPEVTAPKASKKKGHKALIASVVVVVVVAALGLVLALFGGKEEPSLFDLAEATAPMTEFGFDATYGEVFDWLMTDSRIKLEQQGDTAYLQFSGTVTGGDYPVSIVLEMTGLSVNEAEQMLYPYSMTLNEIEVPDFNNPKGALMELFWAHKNRNDYKTFMDFVSWDNENAFGTFSSYFGDKFDNSNAAAGGMEAINSMDEAWRRLDVWVTEHPVGGNILSVIGGAAANEVESISQEYYVLELWDASEVFVGLVYVRKVDGYMSFEAYDGTKYDLDNWYEEITNVASNSVEPLKEILYHGVPVYSYLGRSIDDVLGEFEYYQYSKYGDVVQGREIYYCLCEDLFFAYVEDNDNQIVSVSVSASSVTLSGSSLELTPNELISILPYPYYNEFDYEAFVYLMKYSMPDVPASVDFTMYDAVSPATDITFILD